MYIFCAKEKCYTTNERTSIVLGNNFKSSNKKNTFFFFSF